MSERPPKLAEPPAPLDESEVVACVESDRYCDACGYNLITLPVFKDARTGLFLLRCTECGAVHAAGLPTGRRPVWAARLAAPALFIWIGFILFVLFIMGATQTGMQALMLEEITEGWGASKAMRGDFPEFRLFMTTIACVSAFAGLVQTTLLATVAYHWRRWGYFIAAMLLPMAPLAMAVQAWRWEAPLLVPSGMPFMLGLYGAAAMGAMLGAMFGRKAMRLLASLLLPPKARQMVAFLWLADGLAPPKLPARRP